MKTKRIFDAYQTTRNRPWTFETERLCMIGLVHACIDPGGKHFADLG
jgi:hypothetical protein